MNNFVHRKNYKMCRVGVLKKLSYLLILFYTSAALCAENNSVITNHTTSEENPINSTNSGIYLPLKKHNSFNCR